MPPCHRCSTRCGFCLDRNDLDSARVLLQAELVLHKDDPRVLALEHEVQVRAASVGHAHPPARTDSAPPVPRPSSVATRPASRAERSRYAELPAREHAASPSRNVRTRYAVQASVAMGPAQRGAAPGTLAASVETRTAPLTPVSPAAVPTAAAVAPLLESQPVHQAAPVAQPVPTAQPAQPAQAAELAQPAQPAQPAVTLAQSNHEPKTRAEVRIELERARSDGDLPRFGNPDPAGPGGAMSMTVNPGAMSH